MPAYSCSIYDIPLENDINEISNKLQREQLEKSINTPQGPLKLRTYFSRFYVEAGILHGIIAYETLTTIPQIDAEPALFKSGNKVKFAIYPAPHSYYLLCFSNRNSSDATAMRINKALRQAGLSPIDCVFDHTIPTAFIENFLNRHANHILKVGGWKDLDYVGVNKSTLHGGNLDVYNGTREYDLHGSKCYVMVELPTLGLVVRISDVGIVTFYGNMDSDNVIAFLRTEIFPYL